MSLITYWISSICLAPGRTSVFNVNAPAAMTPKRSSKYWYASWNTTNFEERFGVRGAGALTLNTDVLPGAKQIDEIQDVIKDKGIKCIFSEPQFNPKIISTIAQDMNIKTGVFDPLGANIESDKDLYFKLISNLGNELKGC